MKIEISKCDDTCPFCITNVDFDCVGYDTMVKCYIIKFLRLKTDWSEDSIACFDSRDLAEPIEMCDYCKELERQAEETDIWEEKDENKCSCVYKDVKFIHPKKCPLLNEDITIAFKKDL
jgi:hypothetical protein